MFRIRFHGRGGQGMKTASRMLGTAFFLEGFEVQDAPRYGAERRGAPMSAYVRADRKPINERGIILDPDLVVVADDTLVATPAAGVMEGLGPDTVLLIDSVTAADEWRRRLNHQGRLVVLPAPSAQDRAELPTVGAACVGAAARLLGVIGSESVAAAVRQEIGSVAAAYIEENMVRAQEAYDAMAEWAGIVTEGRAGTEPLAASTWTTLENEDVARAGPAIRAAATSVEVRTGLWRILRPVIDYDLCNRCNWICGSYCPDSAISVAADGRPVIDYDHCKGCMICVAQCPPHAIAAVPETQTAEAKP